MMGLLPGCLLIDLAIKYTDIRMVNQVDSGPEREYFAAMAKLSTQEAADRLGISQRRVLALIQSGKLKATRVGGVWIIDERTVEAFRKLDRPPGRPWKSR